MGEGVTAGNGVSGEENSDMAVGDGVAEGVSAHATNISKAITAAHLIVTLIAFASAYGLHNRPRSGVPVNASECRAYSHGVLPCVSVAVFSSSMAWTQVPICSQ